MSLLTSSKKSMSFLVLVRAIPVDAGTLPCMTTTRPLFPSLRLTVAGVATDAESLEIFLLFT